MARYRSTTPSGRSRSRGCSPSPYRKRSRPRSAGSDKPPALKAALQLLDVVVKLFQELCLDLLTCIPAVLSLAFVWQLGWVSRAYHARSSQQRRLIAWKAFGKGCVDAMLAPLWLLVQVTPWRGQLRAFREREGELREKLSADVHTPAWWAPTAVAFCHFYSTMVFISGHWLSSLLWRSAQYKAALAKAWDFKYATFWRVSQQCQLAIVPSCIITCDLVLASLTIAGVAAPGSWFIVVGAAIFTALPCLDVVGGNQSHSRNSWAALALTHSGLLLSDVLVTVLAAVVLALDPFLIPWFYRIVTMENAKAATREKALAKYFDNVGVLVISAGKHAIGAVALVPVVLTMYRIRQLRCKLCCGRSNDPFDTTPRWYISSPIVAGEVWKDVKTLPYFMVLLTAPWRLYSCWSSLWHAYGSEHRRLIIRQQTLLCLIDWVTIFLILIIVITVIRLPSLIRALRNRKSGEQLRQTVFRHMRTELGVDTFMSMEKADPFDANERVPVVDVTVGDDDDGDAGNNDDDDDSDSDSDSDDEPATRSGRAYRRDGRVRRSTTPAPRRPPKPLQGMTICITGTMQVLRAQAHRRIKAAGGKVSTSVTRRVTHLVLAAGGINSTKHRRALQYDIVMLQETDLWRLLDD